MIDQLLPNRESIAKACRVMGKLDITKSTFGHISQRLPDQDLLLIRARGPNESGLRFTTADDIILVDFDGRKIAGPADLDVPKEVFIHSWLYKTRPDVRSVLHAHPATVMLFTICKKPLLPLFGAYDPNGLRLVKKELSSFPSSVLISDDTLGKSLAQSIGSSKACLMHGHGITTCGASAEEATLTAIQLNELAEINYRAHLLGGAEPISDEDSATFDRLEAGSWQPYWRYYCRLAGEA
jgi:ribulose-5-phosphate 4-epimerase/fuculose-1-phosphate aldolase